MAKLRDEIKELRGMKTEALQKRLKDLREELTTLNFQTKADEVKNVHQMHQLKKQIARTLTVLAETEKR